MIELVKILAPVLVLGLVKALFDFHKIRKGLGVNHLIEWLIWAVLFIAIDWLFELSMWALPLQSFLSWLYFDMLLNEMRGRHLFYVGSTAWIDVQLRRLPFHEVSAFVLKLLLISASVILYNYGK
jgi:hypothetical protein